MPTPPTLTPTKLRAWLDSLPPDQPCGLARSSLTCPLACYLDAAHGIDTAQVGNRTFSLLGPDGPGRRLPRWAQAFVRAIDDLDLANGSPPVTAQQAQAALTLALEEIIP